MKNELLDREIDICLLRKVCQAVLVFHQGGPWTSDQDRTWRNLTHNQDATTRVLCDLIRGALEKTFDPLVESIRK